MLPIKWSFSSESGGPPWPNGDDGNPVPPVFLVHLRARNFEGQIVVNLLESAGIPVVTLYPNNGSFGRVVLGISGTGVDLYVPETLLADAEALIAEQNEGDTADVEG